MQKPTIASIRRTVRRALQKLRLGLTLSVALLMLGCAASKEEIVQFQEDHSEFRARLVQLDRQQQQTQADIDSIKALLGENVSQELRAMQADQSATSQDFERRLYTLTNRFEENERLLSSLLRSLEEVNKTLRSPETIDGVRASAEERALYDQGQEEYLRGEYELARMGYRELLNSFPESPLADDALYWLAESFMADEQPDSAQTMFNRVLGEYPDSNRLPATLLKLGILAMDAGEDDAARGHFETITRDFPDSPEAEQAAMRLEDL
ncbi:tetratricopeptide repeat protein [bacterium]|nr:tetratricopeptide repeat protein [bacterium]